MAFLPSVLLLPVSAASAAAGHSNPRNPLHRQHISLDSMFCLQHRTGQSVMSPTAFVNSCCPSAPYIWTKVFSPLGWWKDACHWGQILLLDVFLLCAEENQNIICVAAFGTFILHDLIVHICLTLLCLSTF
eukprot:s4426_g4.t1